MDTKKQLSDITDKFFKRHYNGDEEPKDLLGRIHYVLFGNLLAVIFWASIGIVTGFLLLLMFIDLLIWLIRGKTFFGFDNMGSGGD